MRGSGLKEDLRQDDETQEGSGEEERRMSRAEGGWERR
jgi:hypothetical protein